MVAKVRRAARPSPGGARRIWNQPYAEHRPGPRSYSRFWNGQQRNLHIYAMAGNGCVAKDSVCESCEPNQYRPQRSGGDCRRVGPGYSEGWHPMQQLHHRARSTSAKRSAARFCAEQFRAVCADLEYDDADGTAVLFRPDSDLLRPERDAPLFASVECEQPRSGPV